MGNSVNNIPSINTPLTDSSGRINPTWYEFLRSFLAISVEISPDNPTGTANVVAGNGLTGGGDVSAGDVTLAVGAGLGITVNANDVNVDISSQQQVGITGNDEIMFSDVSDNNNIRKTRVRDINALASNPAGLNTYVQYNDSEIFGADAGFVYDKAGSATLTGTLQATKIQVDGQAVNYIYFDGTSGTSGPRVQSSGSGGFTIYANQSGSNIGSITFGTSANPIAINVGTGLNINLGNISASGPGCEFQGNLPLRRCINAAITASTTQTQGNGALSRDYNNVSTVANANDTVTLPTAIAARMCLVINSGANTLQVFPASGDDLGAGLNTSTTIVAGALKLWVAIDATTWKQIV